MPSPLELSPPQPAMVGQPGPPPQASVQGLAQGQGANPQGPQGGDQSLQIVTQHLMTAEQELQAAIKIKPELSAVLDAFLNNVKPQIGQILFGGGNGGPGQPGAPQPPPAGIGSSLLASAARGISAQP